MNVVLKVLGLLWVFPFHIGASEVKEKQIEKYTKKYSKAYDYSCKILKVVDGDTVDVQIDLWFGVFVNRRLSVYGIETPEIRAKNKIEKKAGLLAKKEAKKLLPKDSKQTCLIAREKRLFDSYVTDFKLGEKTYTQIIQEKHLGIAYYGQSKKEAREAHEANYEKLGLKKGKTKDKSISEGA